MALADTRHIAIIARSSTSDCVQLYQCPSDPTGDAPDNGTGIYGVNAYFGETNGGYVNLAQISRSAETFAIGENGDGDWVIEPNGNYWPTPPWPDTGWVKAIHNGGSNFAFLDGHAKWMGMTTAHENNLYWWLVTK